jgi:hypothetical protein
MAQYDRLPPALRSWMAGAVLPWSAQSCLKIWDSEMSRRGSTQAALDRLTRAEQRLLHKAAQRAPV